MRSTLHSTSAAQTQRLRVISLRNTLALARRMSKTCQSWAKARVRKVTVTTDRLSSSSPSCATAMLPNVAAVNARL
jgi:hypothetical protein